MKKFNVFTKPIKVTYYFRVEAETKAEAVDKLQTLGFNCGERLSTETIEDLKVESLHEISETEEERKRRLKHENNWNRKTI